MDGLADAFEEHVRDALARAEPDFPAFAVDSWSDPAVVGQWAVIEDDEGRRSQARLDELIARGLPIRPGRLRPAADRLAGAVLAELRRYVVPGGTVVSRPRPGPESEEVYRAHLGFRGVWLMLTVGTDPAGGTAAVLSALLGRAVPLAEPEEAVVWL